MAAELTFYSSKSCPYAARTHAVLIEKGVSFKMVEVPIHHATERRPLRHDEKPDWFLKLSPYGKVRRRRCC